jgi:ABC-2 type transport system permease protein
MLPAIRAEWRKLFTVRSTYILSLVAIVLTGLISFWPMGLKGNSANNELLMEAAFNSGIASMLIAIIAILLITHEYRYNTIMYTLTASNSRSKVLLAKVGVMTIFTVLFTVVAAFLAVGLTWLGVHIGPGSLVPQEFYYWDSAWRLMFGSVAYVWAGLLFGFLFRHVVGALVVFLIVPNTLEGLLTLVLKDNNQYLPFTALSNVQYGDSPGKAALIFTGYLVVGWAVAWFLFLKRDAN